MFHQRSRRRNAAVNQVDNAFGQIEFVQQFKQQFGAKRSLRRWLEDEGIAAGDGGRQEPQRHHKRKIERRNGGEDAGRLAHRRFIDARTDVFQAVAPHQHRRAHGKVNAFNAAAHLAPRLVQSLAVFLDDNLRDFLEIVFNQYLEMVHILRPIQHRRTAPFLKTIFGRLHRPRDIARG